VSPLLFRGVLVPFAVQFMGPPIVEGTGSFVLGIAADFSQPSTRLPDCGDQLLGHSQHSSNRRFYSRVGVVGPSRPLRSPQSQTHLTEAPPPIPKLRLGAPFFLNIEDWAKEPKT
jgi:hypothetical protein